LPRRALSNNQIKQKLQKPDWIKVNFVQGKNYKKVREASKALNLNTVCQEANCPNIYECWNGGTATFMLLGDICTRGCRFCHVKSGNPKGVVDVFEPENTANAVKELELEYVVLTSVDRDDLSDGGSVHFAETVNQIYKKNKNILIEVLIPDFSGNLGNLSIVAKARPTVIAHNIETTRTLTPLVRDARASYDRSLKVLRNVKELDSNIYTKSSIMLGFGEKYSEVIEAMRDLRRAEVDILTIGQYLQPSDFHISIKQYVHPDEFIKLKDVAEDMGFKYVVSGPLVRSSYKAGEYFVKNLVK
jgi:lipoic acid synthetase|tara:strand:+ start:530 stop:1435 length:906 start_codon:yes stop_codon:yes gene_type:complete